ncbi:MAG: succinate dehydrogenase iron-sulfur subunit [Planctomycetes bacterium]|nr:succinate dehydrogenase iron-sulfur subunit [Planctomycetota bacterium]
MAHQSGHGHGHASVATGHRKLADWIDVRVLRQDGPGQASYWERHRIPYEPEMNVISVLQRMAAQAKTVDGRAVAPVAWECNCLEEVCGACTMVINGRVRQSCSALVDRLLRENPGEIELQPMGKFPVVRDLVVDRGRLFRALERMKAWIPVDGYFDMGQGLRQSQSAQEEMYPLSECMSCGCCLEACPQYTKIELARAEGETDEAWQARVREAYDLGFAGAHAISQVMLFNAHPTGRNNASERLDALTDPGGIQDCGNAQNCVAVCPKRIPLTTSIGRAGRAATLHSFRSFFDR